MRLALSVLLKANKPASHLQNSEIKGYTVLKIDRSGNIYSANKVGPKIEPWGTP